MTENGENANKSKIQQQQNHRHRIENIRVVGKQQNSP